MSPPLRVVDPRSKHAAPVRSLQLTVELSPARRPEAAILVTGPMEGEGATTVASSYAMLSAFAKRSTLLVDGGLSDPSLHAVFAQDAEPGLADVLAENVPFDTAVRPLRVTTRDGRTPLELRLDVLTAGSGLAATRGIVDSDAMASLIALALASFDAVIIDAPPALTSFETQALAAADNIDTVIVASRHQREHHVERSIRQLQRSGANVLGLVLNDR